MPILITPEDSRSSRLNLDEEAAAQTIDRTLWSVKTAGRDEEVSAALHTFAVQISRGSDYTAAAYEQTKRHRQWLTGNFY